MTPHQPFQNYDSYLGHVVVACCHVIRVITRSDTRPRQERRDVVS